ncbi:MAG: hypothetical protein ABI550_06075, partial [Ignavibacteriaceae bacterium]
MQIPDGLYFYEFILLILGVLLFTALLIILIIYAAKGRELKVLLPFFIIPILMIGFPGYQKISYDNGVVTIEKKLEELAKNPSDSSARKDIQNTIADIENRPTSNTETLINVGKGSAAVGDTVKALSFINDAIKLEPNLSEAKRLKKLYSTPPVNIEKLSSDLQNNPNNITLRRDLQKEVNNYKDSSHLSAASYENISTAHLVLGDTTKALKYADSALIINPNL